MLRKIIQIDEEKCNSCGLCIPNCQEGALQIIDGKARLVSDLFCDGLGACLGHCPEGAIEIVAREAEPYDEIRVMEILVGKGKNTVMAHLEHLKDHREEEFLQQAINYLKENKIDMSTTNDETLHHSQGHACPGSLARDFKADGLAVNENQSVVAGPAEALSELRQWPVQMHLLNPSASYFRNADVVLAADCAAFAMGNFHSHYLKGKSLAIACPKLDSNKESYIEKLTEMIAGTKINSLTVIMMEVPCCGGLLQFAKTAREKAGRNIPVKKAYISIRGEVLEEEWDQDCS